MQSGIPLNVIHGYIETEKDIGSVPLFCAECTTSVAFSPFCYGIANPEWKSLQMYKKI